MKVTLAFSFTLLFWLGFLLSACSIDLELANATNGPVVLSVDGGPDEVVASGKSLKKSLEGPSRAVRIIGYGSFLEDFSSNFDLSTAMGKKVTLLANLSRLRVQNSSGQTASAIYLAPVASGFWTSNIGPISSGASSEYRLSASNWDFMALTGQVSTTLSGLNTVIDKTLTVTLSPNGAATTALSGAPVISGAPPRENTYR